MTTRRGLFELGAGVLALAALPALARADSVGDYTTGVSVADLRPGENTKLLWVADTETLADDLIANLAKSALGNRGDHPSFGQLAYGTLDLDDEVCGYCVTKGWLKKAARAADGFGTSKPIDVYEITPAGLLRGLTVAARAELGTNTRIGSRVYINDDQWIRITDEGIERGTWAPESCLAAGRVTHKSTGITYLEEQVITGGHTRWYETQV